MAQIFISYGTPDRPRVQTLARAIEREGWSVWWDREIPLGSSFDEVIEQQLEAAECVIVVWSKTSVVSNWVKVEAAEALRRRILIPLQIEDCKIPMEFRRFQAAQLHEWDGDLDSQPLRRFIDQVRRVLVQPGGVSAIESPTEQGTPGPTAAASASAVSFPPSGPAEAPSPAVKATPAATPPRAPANAPAPTAPPRAIDSTSRDVRAGRPVFQADKSTPASHSPPKGAGQPGFRLTGPILWVAAGLVAVVMLVALYPEGGRENQEQPVAAATPSETERPTSGAPVRADAATPSPTTPDPVVPAAVDAAQPAAMTRETRIQSWLSARLYGHDNDAAALRRVTITGTGDRYVALITNQFGFSCNLQFDSDGNPSDLSNCTSKTDPTWFVAESHIPLRCRVVRSEESCSGRYTLGSQNYKDPAEMVIARKID